jgi:hypothetical protein
VLETGGDDGIEDDGGTDAIKTPLSISGNGGGDSPKDELATDAIKTNSIIKVPHTKSINLYSGIQN